MAAARPTNLVLQIVLGLALVLPVLAGVPAEARPVSPEQKDEIDAFGPFDPGAPFGTWDSIIEPTAFYLYTTADDTGEGTIGQQPPPVGGSQPINDFTLHVPQPADDVHHLVLGARSDSAAVSEEEAIFDARTGIQVLDDLRIYEFQARLFASGLEVGKTLRVEFSKLDRCGDVETSLGVMNLEPEIDPPLGFDTGDPNSLVALGTLPYSGSLKVGGVDGVRLQRHTVPGQPPCDPADADDVLDETLRVRIVPNLDAGLVGGVPVVLHLGAPETPSGFTLFSDSARLNVWTENRFGDVTDLFPSGPRVETADRRVSISVLHANVWGNQDCTPASVNAAGDNLCEFDNLNQVRHRLRIRDDTPEHPTYLQYLPLDIGSGLGSDPGQRPTSVACCSSTLATDPFRPVVYQAVSTTEGVGVFTYTFVYGDTLADGSPFLDGKYTIQVFEDARHWTSERSFHVGRTGFTFELAPAEQAQHTVGLGQRTEYELAVTNLGGGLDTFGIAIPVPGGGWSATASPNTLSLISGATAKVTVTVTPPASGAEAGHGFSKAVRVDAVSLLDNSVKSLTLTTVLNQDALAANAPRVDLTSVRSTIEGRPGTTQVLPITIRNLDRVQATYIVTASADGAEAAAGWTFTVNPPYVPLYAQSLEDLLLTVRAPPEATPGSSFVLRLRATTSTSSTVLDTLELPVSVLVKDGLSTLVQDGPERVWRDESNVAGTQDDDEFDSSAVYRVRIENTGDRLDRYTMSGSWNPSVGTTDADNCDEPADTENPARGDGIPDGWRYRLLPVPGAHPFLPPMGASAGPQYGVGATNDNGANQFSGEIEMGTVDLPAHNVVDAYVQVGYVEPGGTNCPTGGDNIRTNEPSTTAQLRVTLRSANDPTVRQVIFLDAQITDRGAVVDAKGNSPAAIFGVAIEPGLSTVTFQDDLTEKLAPQAGFADYRVRAHNTGNQDDVLIISLTPGSKGWTHQIVPGSTFIVPSDPTPGVGTHACNASPSGGLVCNHMGVYDEVQFTVRATPPLSAKVGDDDTAVVTVTSGGRGAGVGGTFDDLELFTTVTGTYLFALDNLDPNQQVVRGHTTSFPFTLRNLGTADDTYLLQVTDEDDKWLAALSSAPLITVPAGRNFQGYLTVTVPGDAPTTGNTHFRVQVTSQVPAVGGASSQSEVLDFFATAQDSTQVGTLTLDIDPLTVLAGSQATFQVVAKVNSGSQVDFSADPDTLPRGWRFVCGSDVACVAGTEELDRRQFSGGQAVGDYTIVVPSGELGISRTVIRICAVTDSGRRLCEDAEINLASTYGVQLPEGPIEAVVAPGVTFVHKIPVRNTGLTPQTVSFQVSTPPTDCTPPPPGVPWQVATTGLMDLQPGQQKTLNVTVVAPACAQPGDSAVLLLLATVGQDTTKTDQVTLVNRVGAFGMDVVALSAQDSDEKTFFLAPGETARFILNVTNIGDFSDDAHLTVSLPIAYSRIVRIGWPAGCDDKVDATTPNEAFCVITLERSLTDPDADPVRQVALEVELPPQAFPRGSKIPITVTAASVLSSRVNAGTAVVIAEILPYQAQDVDADATTCPSTADPFDCDIFEYAVDRDDDLSNGYEDFTDPSPYGVATEEADLQRYLSDEARLAYSIDVDLENGTTVKQLEYPDGLFLLDGDNDGRRDYFLDVDADGLPDVYWDPDLLAFQRLRATKDVTRDGVREFFVDVDGNGTLDVWFDLVKGEFGPLIQANIDGDDFKDYIVDLDRDGVGDPQEPVLIASGDTVGGIAKIIQLVDMNGDCDDPNVDDLDEECLDTVIDEDGDGEPDSFVPYGAAASIPITVQDVTGDGHDDWTYPSEGAGHKIDSYYDWYNERSGFIDSRSVFMQDLQKYWWIGALFGVVLALFIVLVIVTRR